MVTTDGSISEIPREELPWRRSSGWCRSWKQLGKPFVILLNSTHPGRPGDPGPGGRVGAELRRAACWRVSCLDLDAADTEHASCNEVLYQFPVRELDFALPRWVHHACDKGHWLQTEVYSAAMTFSEAGDPDERPLCAPAGPRWPVTRVHVRPLRQRDEPLWERHRPGDA